MFILDFSCDTEAVVKLAEVSSDAIFAVQVAVPVLLIIFGMIDLIKSVIGQKEDEIKKGQQVFIRRMVTAAMVFFVVAVVRLFVQLVAPEDSQNEMMKCINMFVNNTGGSSSSSSSSSSGSSSSSSSSRRRSDF